MFTDTLPSKKGLYRVSYYDEFANAVKMAYLTLPLYAYLKGRQAERITGYSDSNMDSQVAINPDNLIEDYFDEDLE